jgi:hypothetical protein
MSGVVVFGEASRGLWGELCSCHQLIELYQAYGEPTQGSLGLYWAIQALLKGKSCLFWRVRQESLALEDYHLGLCKLHGLDLDTWEGLFLPNMSEPAVLEQASFYCKQKQKVLLMDPLDLQDWLLS